MSSSYQLLCLSHDPATYIMEIEDPSDLGLLNAISNDALHHSCDTLITRTSGGLSEVGCPGIKSDQCGGHGSHMKWVEADILRLLYHTHEYLREPFRDLLKTYTFRCWTEQRLIRLRYVLSVTEESHGT